MIKAFVVDNRSAHNATWIEDVEVVRDIEKAQVVVFTGGEDINPSIYGQEAHETTYFNENRDRREIEAYNKIRPDQLIVSICRGAQLCCALNGGILVQDVDNHWTGSAHKITNGVEEYTITSLHHQMMYPFNMPKSDYKILYRSSENKATYYRGYDIDPENFKEFGEPEIILFKKKGQPMCLAIQGHPEMMAGSKVDGMINRLIKKYIKRLEMKKK